MFITFYSYKGGVGRTQLLANVAVGLSNRGLKVVMIDMDLESPGLHNYFYLPVPGDRSRPLVSEDFLDRPGLIDLLTSHWNSGDVAPDLTAHIGPVEHPNRAAGELWLLQAGRFDSDYPHLVTNFPWERFYGEARGYAFMEYLRSSLLEGDGKWRGADVVLIDSRTGLTDVSSICTAQLPDVLIMLFALHTQGIEGARIVAQAVNQYRQSQEGNSRLRQLYLLPSRVEENGALELRDEMLDYAATNLAGLGNLLNSLEDRLPYDPRVAYREQVIVGSEAKPTNLSIAYERFIDRLAADANFIGRTPDSSGTAITTHNVAPAELLSAFEKIKTRAVELLTGWRGLRKLSLNNMGLQVQRLMDVQRAVHVDYDRLIVIARALTSAETPCILPKGLPSELPEGEGEGDWDGVLSTLSESCDRIVGMWIVEWEEVIRSRLVKAAGGLFPEVEQQISDLRLQARKESLDSLEALVRSAEQYLNRDALDQLLVERKLTSSELQRVIGDAASRRLWLENRLTRLQEEGDVSEPAIVNQLWNALKLLAEMLLSDLNIRPEPAHWSAYDILCMVVAPVNGAAADHRELECFEQIGKPFWHADWAGLLAQNRLGDSDWPCGLEARQQLTRVAQMPDALASLVDVVGRMLSSGPHAYPDLRRLIEYRHDDPILKNAILRLGMDASVGNRREVLGNWLNLNQQELAGATLVTFLHVLSDDGYEAEAFYGACGVLARNPELLVDHVELWADIVARFIVLLCERGNGDAVGRLLLQADLIDLLIGNATGLGLLAVVASFPPESASLDDKSLTLARLTVVHKCRSKLPDAVIEWLDLTEQRVPNSRRIQEELPKLQETVARRIKPTIYRNWEAAAYFENAFAEHWQNIYDRLIRETRPLPSLRAEFFTESGPEWIERTYRTLRDEGRRATVPERSARQNLLAAYGEVIDALTALLEARHNGFSVLQIMEYSEQRNRALRAMRDWFTQQLSANPSPAIRRVFGLIEEPAS